ncbi:MAG: CvpA family protein [Anaerolineae bacterium]
MTSYDWLLVFLGGGLVVFFAYQRLVRGLLSLVAIWSATLVSAALYRETTFRLQAITGENPVLARGVVFDALLVIFFVGGFILIRLAFPVTKLPNIGFLDNLLGLFLGVIIAMILVTLLVNSMGVMVEERWEADEEAWARLRYTYLSSGLRPYTIQVLSAYGWLFVPFFRGLPPVLMPQ